MRRVAAALIAMVLAWPALPALADGSDPGPRCSYSCDRATVDAQDDHFGIHEARHPSDHVPGRGSVLDGRAPGKLTWFETDEYATPICSTNGLNGGDAMCMAAATYCRDGRVAFWVWHQITTYTLTPPATEPTKVVGPWHEEQGVFCLGADDPKVPTIGKVTSWVQDHFDTLGITPAGVTAAPAPRTLVNIETRLSAGSAAVVDIPAATPWSQVVIHAKPLRWRWFFGDGTQSPPQSSPDITHVYKEAGLQRGVHVEVEWGGTFSVAGDATAYPIAGTALVRSADITLDVRQARSELVSR
jgi:hypothetical protein